MLLVVNIGNSNIRFGLSDGQEIKRSWTINSKPHKSEDEYFTLISHWYTHQRFDIAQVEHIVIGSVVPPLTPLIADALFQLHRVQPVIVHRDSPSDVQHESSQLGTDLYANAVAAQARYEGTKLVVDFGTALTMIGIGATGEMLGVIIAPGVNTALQALIGDTAQLPDIELTKPAQILGMDTISCMQSGMVYGYLSMVEGLIDRVNAELDEQCYVIATGGLSHVYGPLSHKIDVSDKLHTLKGLQQLYYNTANS